MFQSAQHILDKYFFPLVLRKRALNNFVKYKNACKGDVCYLFADGISLKYFDLKKFSGKTAIPCTLLPFHKDVHELNIPFGLFIEPYWFYPVQRYPAPPYPWLRYRIQSEYHKFIKKRKDITFFLSLTNYFTVWNKNVVFVPDRPFTELPASHLGNIFNSVGGTIHFSILFAIYLGFHKIYLLGFDYTHKPAMQLHWYERGTGISRDMRGYNEDFFRSALEHIDIISVTVNGEAEHLPSIAYKELTGSEPVFRENDELVDRRLLELLAQWPGYRIF